MVQGVRWEGGSGWGVRVYLWWIYADVWNSLMDSVGEGEGGIKSLQSCLTLCDPMDCSPPGSSVRGILQARILEWVAISFSNT